MQVLTALPPGRRELIRPLFDGFAGLHGLIDSVLEGQLGEAYTDDTVRPRIGHINLDFNVIAGDQGAPAAADAIMSLPAGEHLAVPDSWVDLLLDLRGEALQPYERFAFQAPAVWDRKRLSELQRSLTDGFKLERITGSTITAFAALADSLIYNFASPEDFLARGVGFGIRLIDGDQFVAGCSSFAISSRSLEFEIQTHFDYQRRGFALVTGSRMIEYCIDNQLDPCWDAAHEGSARLAERLGFTDRRPYTAYRLV